ncbi:phosphotransferase enzyme family protein [Aspergillus flavus]|nr:phosphotransferase enzyme family protein [Aspergillus flavus]RAQ67619.1 phosphotransferase enzyme family protein [Aspergillus flavus]
MYRLGKQLISLDLPDTTKKEIDFTDTSFFTTSPNRHLPTPAQVRALSKDIDTSCQPTPIKFRNLNLIVKFGFYVTIVEALNLWMVKKGFHDKVPVPGIFGWPVDDEGYVFIYMELIEGPTLEECWNRLCTIEKRAISDQLSRIAETLRQLKKDPSDHFIGSINREWLLDYVFLNQLITGPFPSIKEFNDWFAYPNHGLLPDNGEM